MNASNLISFILEYIDNSKDVLEGDYIQIEQDSKKIRNANDVNKWLQSIKKLVGYRKYNILKKSFEDSISIDVGFINMELDMDDRRLNYIHEL